jgi:drug/metabolite transporter (DMT)-like permease
LTEEWVRPSGVQLAELASAALLLSIGYATSILAVRLGEMSVTASFRYVAVVFGIALGFLVWGDIPDAATLFGSLIIVAAGLYTLYRERRRATAARVAALSSADGQP